jgi:hypothetical protein
VLVIDGCGHFVFAGFRSLNFYTTHAFPRKIGAQVGIDFAAFWLILEAERAVFFSEGLGRSLEGLIPSLEGHVRSAAGLNPSVEGLRRSLEWLVASREGLAPLAEGLSPLVEGLIPST